MTKNSSAMAKTRGRRRAVPDHDGRERLLDCAIQLFAEQGIATTTMAQIAAAAGVTSAMVHYYFKNRETLLDVVVEERIMRAIRFVWQREAEDADLEADAITHAHALIDRLFEMTSGMPSLPALWLREIVSEGGLLRTRMLAHIPMSDVMRFARRVGAAQKEGSVNPGLEPALLFLSILGLVMLPLATSNVWQTLRGMPKISRDALHRHVTALLTNGLEPPRKLAVRPRHAAKRSRA